MKTRIQSTKGTISYVMLSLFVLAVFSRCTENNVDDSEMDQTVETLTDIEGEYIGSGECIVTKDGEKVISIVQQENDNIKRFPGAKENLFKVEISAKGFHEVELGALTGRTLRTATSAVSDSTYPVLEEYVFDVDASGEVVGFTKTVRNPDPNNFKACVIYGKKVK